MSKVVVTGAAGFIGQHLVRRLLASSVDEVVALDNLSRGKWNSLTELVSSYSLPPSSQVYWSCGPLRRAKSRLLLVEGDVRDLRVLDYVMRGAHTVFHLAAQSQVMEAEASPNYTFQANVLGTLKVLSAARNAGARCIVFASSREVYGESQSLPVREDAPLKAKNRYGASKIAAELWCRASGLVETQIVVLRLTNVYGPDDWGRVVSIFAERARQGLPLVLYGGEQVLDFIPVSFAVEAILRAAEVKPAEPVNVGSGCGTALKDLARLVNELAGSSAGWQVAPARPAEVVRFVADVERMRKLLGLEPPENPLELLPSMLEKLSS